MDLLEDRFDDHSQESDGLEKEVTELLTDLSDLSDRIEEKEEDVEGVESDVSDLESDIEDVDEKVPEDAVSREEFEDLQEKVQRLSEALVKVANKE